MLGVLRSRVFGVVVAVTVGLGLGSVGCSGYNNNDLELVVTYTAKDFCSCLWVMGQTEDYCRAWTAARPQVAEIRIDHTNRIIESRALLIWQQRAQWVGERHGCVILDD